MMHTPDAWIEREEPSGAIDTDANPLCECGTECMPGESEQVNGNWKCVNCLDEAAPAKADDMFSFEAIKKGLGYLN